MVKNKILKGIMQVDGTADGFDLSSLNNGSIYFIRTDEGKNAGYIYFNGKKYGYDIDAGEY